MEQTKAMTLPDEQQFKADLVAITKLTILRVTGIIRLWLEIKRTCVDGKRLIGNACVNKNANATN